MAAAAKSPGEKSSKVAFTLSLYRYLFHFIKKAVMSSSGKKTQKRSFFDLSVLILKVQNRLGLGNDTFVAPTQMLQL